MSIKRLTNTNKGVTTMEEFYKAIEDKIKASGYPSISPMFILPQITTRFILILTINRQSFLGHPCIFDIQGYFFKDFFGKCEHCALYRGLL